MERKTRLWLGLSAAVLVAGGGAAPGHALPTAAMPAAPDGPALRPDGPDLGAGSSPGTLLLAQESGFVEGGEGGEGEGGEGGGQILGTITEYRLSSTDPNAFQYDASRQIAAYGALVYERYGMAHAGALRLQEAVTALLATPDSQTLAAARAAWTMGHAAYSQTEAFLFYAGPVDGENGPVSRLNAWPVNESFLDYVRGKAGSGIVNDASIEMNRATIVRLDQATSETNVTTGWHAVEFLLWGEDLSAAGPGERPSTDYIAGQGNNDRRREYLRIAAQLLVNDLSILVAAWAPDTNNYRGSMVAMDQRNAIGRAFNGMAVLAGHEMARRRIGAGLARPGEGYEQSRFSDNTSADAVNNLRGIRNVYFGTVTGLQGAGFDTLMAAIDPAINNRVVEAFDRAEKAVGALPTPYDRILASPTGGPDRAGAEAAIADLTELADALRAAGNRLGVLVLVPGL